MAFLVDINPEMELPKYKLTLHKLNEEKLASLKNITNLNISPLFVGINNLTFDVPLHVMDSDGTNRRNKIYDLIEGDHLVKLNDMSYFIITNVKELADSSGKKYKEVQCKSREYGLIDKKLIDYKADSRVLYDSSGAVDEDGLEIGILNYIFKHLTKSWALNYVDPDLILREGKGIYRALNFDNSNLIQVFMELQKTFNCIFTFDSINRKVSVHDIKNMMGQDRGLRISDTNFIKSITKDVNSEGIITRLYLRGKDGVSIQSISPTGQPYLDNFDYYKNTKYMSQGLIDALDNYDTKVGEYNPDFKPLFVRLDSANTVMEGLLNADGIELVDKGLVALNVKLNQIQALIDVKVEELGLIQKTINSADGVDLSELHKTKKSIQDAMDAFITERTAINGYIKTKNSEITAQQSVIDGINSEIKALQSNLDTSNTDNFTAEQLLELDDFIKVETFNDTNYTEYNLEELKEEGIRQLNRLSQPPIQFEVDVIDFLSIVECQHMWKKFVLGDTVTIEHKEMGFKFVVRLVGYDHDVNNHSLNLKFSNTNSYDDATLYERDLMEHVSNIGTTVDFNTDRWNDVGNVESRIIKLVDSKLEEARQNILNAVGQNHLFDDSGLWLYKENPDGTIDDAQIRGINSDIALTDDNWASVKTAISAKDGINAELVRGKFGQFARIEAEQIEVGGGANPPNIIEYIDSEIVESVDNLGDIINNAFADNKLTNIEVNSIKLSLDNVTAESTNLISNASTLGITTERTNYSTALTTLTNYLNTNWLGKTYPLAITVAQRTNVTTYFKNLEDRKSILLTKITEVREERANSYTDGEISSTKTEFKVTTDAISSKVTGIETDTSGLNTRMTSAESKITKDAIVSTVESNSTVLAKKSDITQLDESLTMKFSKTPLAFRYVKVSLNSSVESAYSYWGELQVWADGINIALGKPVTLDFTPYSGQASNYTDGSKSTRITHNVRNSWKAVTVDLGSVASSVDSIVEFNNSSNRHYHKKVQVSQDGVNWVDVYNSETQGTFLSNYARGNVYYIGGASSGITQVTADGIKVTHSGTNQYSEIRADGFVRQWEYGEARYLNDIWVKSYNFNGSPGPRIPDRVEVLPPLRFRGRAAEVEVILTLSDLDVRALGMARGYDHLVHITDRVSTVLRVYSNELNSTTPRLLIDSYMLLDTMGIPDWRVEEFYGRLGFTIMLIGK